MTDSTPRRPAPITIEHTGWHRPDNSRLVGVYQGSFLLYEGTREGCEAFVSAMPDTSGEWADAWTDFADDLHTEED